MKNIVLVGHSVGGLAISKAMKTKFIYRYFIIDNQAIIRELDYRVIYHNGPENPSNSWKLMLTILAY